MSQAHGMSITSVYRSRTLQARLYRRRQAGLHPYPVAPPGKSLHEQGLAWDMTGDPAELRRLGALWKRMGGRWGGDFRDPIHFEAGAAMLRRATGGRRVTVGIDRAPRP
jgi:hypothetical protein